MYRERGRMRGAMGAALVGALVAAGCETDNLTDLTADRPVLRVLVAPGEAVFPAGSVTPSGADATGAPERLDVTLTGFSPLTGGAYHLWLYNAASGSYAAAEAAIRPADNVDMVTTGATFEPSASEAVYRARVETSAELSLGDHTHVAVSAEPGRSSAPAGGAFLFQRYLDAAGRAQGGAMTFGRPASDGAITPFAAAGAGTASFYEGSLLVELRRLPAPPPGLHYQSYLVSFTGPVVTTFSRGNTITLDARGNAADRLEQSVVGDFGSFSTYLLVLEPDHVPSITEMRVQQSDDYRTKFMQYFGG